MKFASIFVKSYGYMISVKVIGQLFPYIYMQLVLN